MNDLLIGIDIGSTNIRCAVYDIRGRLVSLASCAAEKAYAKTGWGFGGDELTDTVIYLLNEAIGKIEKPFHIHGMAIACVGCGAMLVGHNGKLIHTNGEYKEKSQAFFNRLSPREVFNITGYPVNRDNLAFRIGAHQGDTIEAVLSIADYVAFRLTGEKRREYSTACSMSVWDNRNKEWWRELFNAARVNTAVMGTPVNSGTLAGEVLPAVADRSRVPRGTKVYTGGHDYLCAAFAAGCTSDKEILNIVGTYEIMASFYDKPWQRKESDADPIRPLIDNHVLPGKYSYQIEVYGAGQTEWLRKSVFAARDKEWSGLFAEMDRVPAAFPSGELFIPHIYGQIVPAVNMDAQGAFLYLTGKTGRVSLLRAAVEGLCYKSREMLDAQRKVTARDFTLKMTGGGSKSRTWIQAKADILNLPVHVPHIKEATALGAAMLAGVGAGVYADYNGAVQTAAALGGEVYEPRKDAAHVYNEIYHEKYLKFISLLQG